MNKVWHIVLILTIVINCIIGFFNGIPHVASAYTPHDRIVIEGDADFAAQAANEGWPGNGTEGDPYVIEGYEINSSFGYGIQITLTTVHFIIKDTMIRGQRFLFGAGILLYNVANGIVENCTIQNHGHGIYLYYSMGIDLRNNTMIDNGIIIEGEYIEQWNTHNIDSTNTINNKPVYYLKNQTGGMVPSGAGQVILANCTNIKVQNQELTNGSIGILLGFSSKNEIENNSISSNNIYDVYLYNSDGNNITNNNISCYGYSGIYFEFSNENNIIGNNLSRNFYGARGIYFDNSHKNKIEYNNISDLRYGIYLRDSNENIILNNKVFQNYNGIHFENSTRNLIIDNKISNIDESGIYIESSMENHIIGNNISNSLEGINIWYSEENYIENNIIFSCERNGIYLFKSNRSNIINNNVNLIDGRGILVAWSNRNNVNGNNASYNKYGIVFTDSDENIINANNVSYNVFGINLEISKYCKLTNNTMNNNGIYIGGYLLDNDGRADYDVSYQDSYLDEWNTHEIDISNTVNGRPIYYWKNLTSGEIPSGAGQVIIANCTNIKIKNQEISNSTMGIILGYSSKNSIENNNVSYNNKLGIYLYESFENYIEGNNASNSGSDGIYLFESNDNKIIGNIANNNENAGIHIEDSDETDIKSNNISDNRDGIFLHSLNQNRVNSNTISNNDWGIILVGAYNNVFYHNNIINNIFQLNQSDVENNNWDDGKGKGNYWSDYRGNDTNRDGVGDTDLPHNDVDHYPLMFIYIDTESKGSIRYESFYLGSIIILISLFVLILLIRYKNKRK